MASGLLCLWGFGYYAYGISALFIPIASELGFSRAQTSVAASIGRFEGGFEAFIAGWIFDTTGSYTSAFMLFAVLMTIAAVVLPFARPPQQPSAAAGAGGAQANKIS